MTQLAMKSVYAVPWEETQVLFNSVKIPPRLWRMTATLEEHNLFLAQHGIGPIKTGAQKLGLLDCWNEPIMDSIQMHSGIEGLDAYEHRYPTAGSAQAIGHILAYLAQQGISEIWVPLGDYEGYQYQAENYGIETKYFDLYKEDPQGVTFLSVPSAVDGNEVPMDRLEELTAKHKVVIDYAYHGLTHIRTRKVPKDAWAVLWSISKPFGLFYRRIGFAWVQDSIPALYSTRWFKNPEALLAAAVVVRGFSPVEGLIYDRFKHLQAQAVDICSAHFEGLEPSDCILLSHTRKGALEWRRHPEIARVCVSPAMEMLAFENTKPLELKSLDKIEINGVLETK